MNTTKFTATSTPTYVPVSGLKITNNSNSIIWYSVSDTEKTINKTTDGKHPLMPYQGLEKDVHFEADDYVYVWVESGTAELGVTS
ncbi:hypothetical protein [Arcobacter arenosus]|uniref:Uncharacterized protein n=1 Tax=Arcobacter arenosus TaxID=2576037 RepID=A0A5R8Y4G6_9BACT|nr:hypothetical protein [Arcobacter arenosus]TLP41027.1 hypothetical protein FDK22_03135 [Arcobacter arenosus]